jgi:hypothetical protein
MILTVAVGGKHRVVNAVNRLCDLLTAEGVLDAKAKRRVTFPSASRSLIFRESSAFPASGTKHTLLLTS